MNKYYLAKLQIVVNANHRDEACDAISMALTENLMQEGAIYDWQYVPPCYLPPREVTKEQLRGFGENRTGDHTVKCNYCGWQGLEHDLQWVSAEIKSPESDYKACPHCKTDAYLMDIESPAPATGERFDSMAVMTFPLQHRAETPSREEVLQALKSRMQELLDNPEEILEAIEWQDTLDPGQSC